MALPAAKTVANSGRDWRVAQPQRRTTSVVGRGCMREAEFIGEADGYVYLGAEYELPGRPILDILRMIET